MHISIKFETPIDADMFALPNFGAQEKSHCDFKSDL